MEFAEFIKTLTDIELVKMQNEVRSVQDAKTVNLILIELGIRQRKNEKNIHHQISNPR